MPCHTRTRPSDRSSRPGIAGHPLGFAPRLPLPLYDPPVWLTIRGMSGGGLPGSLTTLRPRPHRCTKVRYSRTSSMLGHAWRSGANRSRKSFLTACHARARRSARGSLPVLPSSQSRHLRRGLLEGLRRERLDCAEQDQRRLADRRPKQSPANHASGTMLRPKRLPSQRMKLSMASGS